MLSGHFSLRSVEASEVDLMIVMLYYSYSFREYARDEGEC